MNNVRANLLCYLTFSKITAKKCSIYRGFRQNSSFPRLIRPYFFSKIDNTARIWLFNIKEMRSVGQLFIVFTTFNTMKKFTKALLFLGFVLFISIGGSSCSKKTGCPINETVQSKTKKDGSYSKKKGSSNLFPKDMRRN